MSKSSQLIPIASIAQRILFLRGQKVMIDADLAELYGVETKALNQAVKRNIERFPPEFMFQLTKSEKDEVVTKCDHLNRLKYSPSLPYSFTEHGALMLGNVLKSPRAGMMATAVTASPDPGMPAYVPVPYHLQPGCRIPAQTGPATSRIPAAEIPPGHG